MRVLGCMFAFITMLGVIAVAIINRQKDAIIVYHGYRAWQQYANISKVVAAVALISLLAVVVIAVVRQIRRWWREKRAVQDESVLTPEDIRRHYETAAKEHHNIGIFGDVLGQLKEMKQYQENLRRLLRSNGISTLDTAGEMLQIAEDAICANCRKAINQFQATGDVRDFAHHSEEAGKANADMLNMAKEYLALIAEKINAGEVEDAQQIMADAIKALKDLAGGN